MLNKIMLVLSLYFLIGCIPVNAKPETKPLTPIQIKTINSFIAMGKKVIAAGKPEWQVKIYKKYIGHPELLKVQMALVTQYNGEEPSGKKFKYTKPSTARIYPNRIAASNRVPAYHYVWTRYGLRQILDTGSSSNDSRADRRGCDFWMDYWYPTSNNPIDGWNKTPVIKLGP